MQPAFARGGFAFQQQEAEGFAIGARGALRQTAQRKLAHGKSGRMRKALDAGRGAGQENRPASPRQHAFRGLLCDQEAAECRDCEGPLHGARIEFGEWALDTRRGVVDHDVGLVHAIADLLEQVRDGFRIGRIGAECQGAGSLNQRLEFLHIAGRQGDFHAERGEVPRNRSTDPESGTDDQRASVGKVRHDAAMAAGSLLNTSNRLFAGRS